MTNQPPGAVSPAKEPVRVFEGVVKQVSMSPHCETLLRQRMPARATFFFFRFRVFRYERRGKCVDQPSSDRPVVRTDLFQNVTSYTLGVRRFALQRCHFVPLIHSVKTISGCSSFVRSGSVMSRELLVQTF